MPALSVIPPPVIAAGGARHGMAAPAALLAAAVVAALAPGGAAAASAARAARPATAARAAATPTSTPSNPACPWLNDALPVRQRTAMLLARMSLADKINMVTGAGTSEPYVFYIKAIPSLCIPAMGEEDGPNGVGDGLTGVTQLPAGCHSQRPGTAPWPPSTARSSARRSAARAPWSTWGRR